MAVFGSRQIDTRTNANSRPDGSYGDAVACQLYSVGRLKTAHSGRYLRIYKDTAQSLYGSYFEIPIAVPRPRNIFAPFALDWWF